MKHLQFTEEDLRLMEAYAITEAVVQRQIDLLRRESCFLNLLRPCTVSDGIRSIPPEDTEGLVAIHQRAAHRGRFLKFVPASGAATRMFHSLFKYFNGSCPKSREELERMAESGEADAVHLLQVVEGIAELALYDELEEILKKDGLNVEVLIQQGRLLDLIDYIVTERGLCCASMPKGLLKFHRYRSGSRTAFEEHLVEAVHYVRDDEDVCRLHFTTSIDHEERFRSLMDTVRPLYEKAYGVRFSVIFSCQSRSSCTIAVDGSNRPFRGANGELVFRPGGHGSLLDNLNDLRGDLVYIKNIDNVIPDRLKESTCLWKKILGGLLVQVQETVHEHVRNLKGSPLSRQVDEAAAYAQEHLLIRLPEGFGRKSMDEKREILLKRLKRPVRVCGVVRNVGEPGGAPFWTQTREGGESLQIVEKAQVNFRSEEQAAIWSSSTHFNPVDVVCAVRDEDGFNYDLRRYVDPEAVFITTKSLEGRELKALELPGLWNGAMSDWITLLVEVPRATFNPVKTINDLLRQEHLEDAT